MLNAGLLQKLSKKEKHTDAVYTFFFLHFFHQQKYFTLNLSMVGPPGKFTSRSLT